jgi:hypothetical protein
LDAGQKLHPRGRKVRPRSRERRQFLTRPGSSNVRVAGLWRQTPARRSIRSLPSSSPDLRKQANGQRKQTSGVHLRLMHP